MPYHNRGHLIWVSMPPKTLFTDSCFLRSLEVKLIVCQLWCSILIPLLCANPPQHNPQSGWIFASWGFKRNICFASSPRFGLLLSGVSSCLFLLYFSFWPRSCTIEQRHKKQHIFVNIGQETQVTPPCNVTQIGLMQFLSECDNTLLSGLCYCKSVCRL